MSAQTVDGQSPVAFQYDNDGLILKAGSLSVSRDASTGLVTGTSLGSLTTTLVQSGFGEVSSLSGAYAGSEFFRNDLSRDAGGRTVRKIETISGSTSTFDYTYDAVGRLTDVAKDGASLSHYGYDVNSNRVSTSEGSTTTTATYDAQDRLIQWGDTAYTFSANGDLASKTQGASTVSYAYDALGNLLTVVDATGIRTDYLLDGQNRRIGKKVNGVLVQGFLWDDQTQISAELDGAGNVVSTFIYATHRNLPDYMVKNGTSYLIVADHLGSPRLVVDSTTGAIAQRLDYDAWGRVILDTNPGFQPFGFAGGLYDTATGLLRFGARDYDPAVGRWTARDPVLFSGGDTNLYGYVLSDPINITDVQGLDTFDCKISLGGGRNPNNCQGSRCHEYLCVIDEDGTVTCGGQGTTTKDRWDKTIHRVPGTDDPRAFNRKNCPLVHSGDACFDECVKTFIAAPRPPYNAIGISDGINCQMWATGVVDICRSRCKSRGATGAW